MYSTARNPLGNGCENFVLPIEESSLDPAENSLGTSRGAWLCGMTNNGPEQFSGSRQYHGHVREILGAVGPALELFGWFALLGAIGFFVVARISRRGHAAWREAPCEVTSLEGQRCLVWSTEDGVAHSRVLAELEHGEELSIIPQRVFFKQHEPLLIRLVPPRSNVRFMLVLAWTMTALWILSNVVPLIMQQLLIADSA